MALDDLPIRVAQQRLASEDLFRNYAAEWVASITDRLPGIPGSLKAILGAFAERKSADNLSRIKYLLDVVIDEIEAQDSRITGIEAELRLLSSEEQRKREQEAGELLADAARKAEGTRNLERIRRIGHIFVRGVGEHAVFDPDEIEELMRVAIFLSDPEVNYLAELVRIEGELLQHRDHIDRFSGHQCWETGSWGDRVNPEITSAFNKLESYELVSRLAPPNNLNLHADFQPRYVLLPKGVRFFELARGVA